MKKVKTPLPPAPKFVIYIEPCSRSYDTWEYFIYQNKVCVATANNFDSETDAIDAAEEKVKELEQRRPKTI